MLAFVDCPRGETFAFFNLNLASFNLNFVLNLKEITCFEHCDHQTSGITSSLPDGPRSTTTVVWRAGQHTFKERVILAETLGQCGNCDVTNLVIRRQIGAVACRALFL
jgi:hypothetical protein